MSLAYLSGLQVFDNQNTDNASEVLQCKGFVVAILFCCVVVRCFVFVGFFVTSTIAYWLVIACSVPGSFHCPPRASSLLTQTDNHFQSLSFVMTADQKSALETQGNRHSDEEKFIPGSFCTEPGW